MTRTNYLFILPMLWASVAFSQSDVDFCAQEYFLNLTQADGASNHQLEAYEQDIFQFFNFRHQKSNNTESGSFAVRTLPVVVHIVHENGVENLSDAQVQQGINWLNEALANSGAFFQGTGADTEIRLCLAQRTPDNQPTNGITHTFSPLTNLEYNQEDAQLKNLIRWNPKDYINIWVVKEICHSNGNCSVAGYTTQWTDHGAADDGIVVEARNFGIDINGTALWVHELGHYFSLYHTFYYGCTNQDCLLQGDKICDTPPDQSTAGAPCDQSVNSCSTDTDSGPFTTDQSDMTWNFMDYGNFSCMHDFTADQTVRMNFCLDGKRNPLLKSKGCSLPCLNPVTAAFSYNPLQVQPGQQVQFTNESQGAASYVWRINGQVFSSQTSPSYTFNTGGVFVVTLTALPLDTTICPVATYQTTFEVICPAQAYFQLDDLSISPGEWVYIQATTSPGSVSWLVDGVHIGASLDSLQLFALGAHTITLQVDNGICTTEYSQTVQVSCEFQAYFELDDYEVLVGEWVYIENLDTGPGAISWFLDDSPLGSNLDSLQLLETGEHKITVRVSSGSCTQEYSRYVLVRAECEFKTWQELINLPDALTGNFLSPVTKMVPLADNNFLLIAADMIQIYLLKVDTAGQLIWSNKIPSVIQNGAYIEFDALGTDDGGFLIVHQSPNNNGLVFGHKLLKFNTNGDFLWSKIFEGPAGKFVAINDLIKTQDGHIVVCGGYLDNGMLWAKIDQDGNLIWSQFQRSLSFGLSLSAAVELPSGRLVFAGKDTQNRKILIGASATGDFLWKKSFNHLSSVSQVPAEIQLFYQPEDGSLLLFGPDDGIYIKSDTLGNFIWSKKGDKTYHLFQLPAGGYLAISEIINRGQVTKIDNELVPTWSRVYPYQSVYFNQALLHPDGGYYAVGTSLGIDFLLPRELYLARLDWSGFAGDCMPLTYPFRTTTYSPPGYSHPLLEETVPVYIDAPPVSVDTTVANLAQLCTETCTRFNEVCNNGIDDDVDGLTDCMDSDCNCPEDPCQTKRFNIWHVGKHRLDFNQNPPAVTIIENEVGPFTSTLCDLDGNLLLYSDEKNVVWNRVNYNIAPSAVAGLGGQLIPNPGSLSMVLNIRNQSGALIIDEIDLTMEMGLGSLDFSWLPSGSSKINRRHAITKACPSGYWIALHRPSSNHLHALLMSEDGTNPFFLFGVESEAGPILGTAPMDMKFSPNGSELVMLDPLNGLHLLQFNSKNGKFFNSRKLPDPPNEFAGTAGAFEFSPDGHYLYLTISKLGGLSNTTKLFQYDLEQPGTPVRLVKELQVFVEDISLGPDHKIYLNPLLSLSPIKYRLDVIHAPNNDGAHINYEENYIDLPVNGSPSIGKWELPVNIATNNYEPRISFYPDSPDTVCGYQTSGFNFRVKTAACFFDAVNWELQGVQGLITATEDTTLGGSKALIQFFESGTAKIIVSAVSPCGSAFDTIEVFVTDPQLLKVNLGPDIQICQNAAVVLDAGAGFVSYHWSTGSGAQVLDVSEPGKYWVDAFDQCGNKSSDTLIVSLSTESVLNLDTLTSPKCSDYSMTFQRPSFFDAWSWSPNIGINCVDCSEVTISSPQSQSWIITAQNQDGCISVDTLHLHIVDTILQTLEAVVCSNEYFQFNGVALPPDTTAIFLLPAPGLGCDTLLTVHVSKLETSTTSFTTTICSNAYFEFEGVNLPADTSVVFHLVNASGCDSVVMVTIESFPTIQLSLPADTTLKIGSSLEMNALVSGGTGSLSYHWAPEIGLSCTECLSTVTSPMENIWYTFTVSDANACLTVDSVSILVDQSCIIDVPNAFTPNGDGANDVFTPLTDPCVKFIRSLQIVNRWGALVYETQNIEAGDPAYGWNGDWQGKNHPSDVLIWKATFELYNGQVETRSGEITLIR